MTKGQDSADKKNSTALAIPLNGFGGEVCGVDAFPSLVQHYNKRTKY